MAILAGPRALLDEMYHTRRMFGGGLAHAWPFAAVALHYLAGFSERYSRAVGIADELIRQLTNDGAFAIEPITSGTNLFHLRVPGRDAAGFQKRLAAQGVLLPSPSADGRFLIGVNETLNRSTATTLTQAFRQAMAD